jgi:nucleoside 2-deoxyribosyltransferase
MQTSNPSIYVAGPINGLSYDAARERRLYVARALAPSGIEVISPMRWKYNLKGVERLGSGGSYDDNPLTAAKGIVTRDRFDVRRCSMMLADLECPAHGECAECKSNGCEYTYEVASGGTFTEFGWADAFGKPIVTVLKPGSVHDHPFVRALSGFIVPTLDEAIDIIKSVLLAEPLPEQTAAHERDAVAGRPVVRVGVYSDGSRVTDWGDL